MKDPTPKTGKKASKKAYKSRQQRAYKYVKNQILNLEYKPSQNVTDVEIAEKLDISRTPVREAMVRLEQEGLLVSEHRRGWKVYAMTLEDIEDIFEIKITLEPMMVKKAAHCKNAEMKSSLKTTFEQMKAAAKDEDFPAWQEADLMFHHIIFNMCSNKKARNIIENLNNQWYRLKPGIATLEGRLDRSISEHEAIVSGILSGDGEQAEQEMRNHLTNVRDELSRVLAFVLNFVPEGV
jgi:GntR family transcriptional regulator, rspAB operon transcriptional repressor